MPGSSSRGNVSFSRLALQIERLRPPSHETYSYSSRSTAGHSRLRSMSETQTPRRQHILLKSRSAPFLRLSLASVPNARLLKATQPPSERSWLIFSDLRVIRRNSTITPVAETSGWQRSMLSSLAKSRQRRFRNRNNRSLQPLLMTHSLSARREFP
jgi:hypothetical protein